MKKSIWLIRLLAISFLFIIISVFITIERHPKLLSDLFSLQIEKKISDIYIDLINQFQKETQHQINISFTNNFFDVAIQPLHQNNAEELITTNLISPVSNISNLNAWQVKTNKSKSQANLDLGSIELFYKNAHSIKDYQENDSLLNALIPDLTNPESIQHVSFLINAPLILGYTADFINPEQLPLSKQSSFYVKYRLLLKKKLNNIYSLPHTLFMTSIIGLFLMTLTILTRRACLPILLQTLQQHHLSLLEAKPVLKSMTPYLIFPTADFETICQKCVIRYRVKLEKLNLQFEWNLFNQSAEKLLNEITRISNYSGIIKVSKNFITIDRKDYTVTKGNQILSHLTCIKKAIQYTYNIIPKDFNQAQINKVLDFAAKCLQTYQPSAFKEKIYHFINNILQESNTKEKDLDESNDQNFDELSLEWDVRKEILSKSKETEKKELIDEIKLSLSSFILVPDLTSYHIRQLKLIKNCTHYCPIETIELILADNSLISNENFIPILKQKNILEIQNFLENNSSQDLSNHQISRPLLNKKVLIAGGDLDQVDNYIEWVFQLGAVKGEVILEDDNLSRNKMKGDFDLYIYIATRISHSLRFQVSNQVQKSKLPCFILNHSRSGFKTELLLLLNKPIS